MCFFSYIPSYALQCTLVKYHTIEGYGSLASNFGGKDYCNIKPQYINTAGRILNYVYCVVVIFQYSYSSFLAVASWRSF